MKSTSHAITKISRRAKPHRGFVITYRPRTVTNPLPRYEVSLGDLSFGLFDAQAQATDYIEQLYAQRQVAA